MSKLFTVARIPKLSNEIKIFVPSQDKPRTASESLVNFAFTSVLLYEFGPDRGGFLSVQTHTECFQLIQLPFLLPILSDIRHWNCMAMTGSLHWQKFISNSRLLSCKNSLIKWRQYTCFIWSIIRIQVWYSKSNQFGLGIFSAK